MATQRSRASLEGFEARLTTYQGRTSDAQRKQLVLADKSIQRRLIAASRQAAGGNRVLSRVGSPGGYNLRVDSKGRRGAALGYKRTRLGLNAIVYHKTGPWQLVDETAGGGDTRPHTIEVDLKKNPRPLTPAKKYMPTLGNKANGFMGLPGTASVQHPGSFRDRYWGRAIGQARAKIVLDMPAEMKRIGRDVWPT